METYDSSPRAYMVTAWTESTSAPWRRTNRANIPETARAPYSELSRKVSSPESVDDRPELKIAARAVSGMFALFVRLHGADVDSVHAVTMYALGDES